MSLEPASVQLFSFKNDWREGVLTFGLLLELLTQDFDRCTFEHDVSHKTTDACSWCLFWNLSGCDTATHEHNRVTVYKKALCALSFSEMSRSSCGLVWIHISSILPSYMTSSLSWIKKNMLQTHRLSLIRGYHFVGESLRKHKHTHLLCWHWRLTTCLFLLLAELQSIDPFCYEPNGLNQFGQVTCTGSWHKVSVWSQK